jgi:hypothetical protein
MDHVSPILELSKHPLVVLLVGAVVGSIVVPRVNARIERTRQVHALKAQRGTDVLKFGFDIERRFNAVTTAFQSFYKDEVLTGIANDDSRQLLRTRVHQAYQEFDRDAWWWHWETLDEARILGLIDAVQLGKLELAVKHYQEALLASTAALDPYWEELLRHSKLVSPEEAAHTVDKTSLLLEECRARRRESLLEMVQIIVS